MAHPKRRQSKTRTAKRRTHDKAVAPTLAICIISTVILKNSLRVMLSGCFKYYSIANLK